MKISDYSRIPIAECGDPMVDLSAFPFVLEPMQFRKGYTQNPQLWLRHAVAAKLEQVQRQHLDKRGWRFRIWDAWRGRDAQNKIYAACWNDFAGRYPDWDETKIARAVQNFSIDGNDPDRIPPHATGGAVDLTIVDEATGQPLDMGCDYCEWRAWPLDAATNQRAAENRHFLLVALQEAGFVQDPDQWWHFDYGNQKWARITGGEVAIYGELDGSMGFMKKPWAFGHGCKLPYEAR